MYPFSAPEHVKIIVYRYLAVGYMAEMIQTYIRNGEQYGMDIDYSY